MLVHFERYPGEPLCLNLQSGMIWNYATDREVVPNGDAKLLAGSPDEVMYERAGKHEGFVQDLRAIVVGRSPDEFGKPAANGAKSAPDDVATPEGMPASPESRLIVAEQSPPSLPTSAGTVGLMNLGNTCYLNSGLQSLSQVPYLARLLTEVPFNSPKAGSMRNPNIAIAVQDFMQEQWQGGAEVLTPRFVLDQLRLVNRMFFGYHQHDAQEALRFVLSAVHDRLSMDVPLWVDQDTEALDALLPELESGPPPMEDPHTPIAAESGGKSPAVRMERAGSVAGGLARTMAAWEARDWLRDGPYVERPVTDQSPISDAFQGLMCSRVRCRECGYESRTFDRFFDLSLGIPDSPHSLADGGGRFAAGATPLEETRRRGFGTTRRTSRGRMRALWCSFGRCFDRDLTLEDCLYNFCDADPLVGTEQYHCDQCRRRVDADKTMSIVQLPEVLCVHLKRFATMGGWAGKVSTHVQFPTTGLDMEPFIFGDAVPVARDVVRSRQNQVRAARHAAAEGTTSGTSDLPAMVVRGDADPPILSDTPYSDAIAAQIVSAAARARVLASRAKVQPAGGPGEGPFLYDLVSVVQHIGMMGGGHYVAYAKHRENNQWYLFNDSSVRPTTEGTVAGKEAYLLFYVRRRNSTPPIPQPDRALTVADAFAYVSKAWWLRREYSVYPGPLSNGDISCDHGRLRKILCGSRAHEFVAPVTWEQWKALVHLYGAQGQPLRSLEPCPDCAEEARALRTRRQQEYDRIVAVDSHEVDQTQGGMDAAWFIVSARWLKRWNDFIESSGDPDGTGRGTLPPGPVDNSDLLRANGQPRPNLRPVTHYRGVNAKVWRFFMSVYGGGPMIRRRELHIYDEPLDVIPPELLGTVEHLDGDNNEGASGGSAAGRRGRKRSRSSALSASAVSPANEPLNQEPAQNPLSRLSASSPSAGDDTHEGGDTVQQQA